MANPLIDVPEHRPNSSPTPSDVSADAGRAMANEVQSSPRPHVPLTPFTKPVDMPLPPGPLDKLPNISLVTQSLINNFANIDSNHDGYITEEEYHKSEGVPKDQTRKELISAIEGVLTEIWWEHRSDGAGTKRESFGEFQQGLEDYESMRADQRKVVPAVYSAVNTGLSEFKILDTDKDGRLSSAEVAARAYVVSDPLERERLLNLSDFILNEKGKYKGMDAFELQNHLNAWYRFAKDGALGVIDIFSQTGRASMQANDLFLLEDKISPVVKAPSR